MSSTSHSGAGPAPHKPSGRVRYSAEVSWERGDQAFIDGRYSRRHWLNFDGGVRIPGSASPHVVRVPLSDPSAVDPEEAFIASLSACHMLFFLGIAAREKMVVDRYEDLAEGELECGPHGRLMMTRVVLSPVVKVDPATRPTRAAFEAMHHETHESCFIASSVLTEVICRPRLHRGS